MSGHAMNRPGGTILLFLLRTLGALPLRFHYACSGFVAWLAGNVLRYRRDVVMTNLARSFPDLKYSDLKAICKDFYRHFAEIVAEAIWFAGCSDAGRLRASHLVEIVNAEEFNSFYDASNGVFLLTAHTGNWELYGGFESYSYNGPFRITRENAVVVYKKLSSEAWDYVMKEARKTPLSDRESFDGMLESREIMRYAVSHKDERKVYVFDTDQHPYKGAAGVDVGTFMHQPTRSMAGAAKLAVKYGMGVCYMTMERVKRGSYHMKLTPICTDASGMSPEEIMKKYYALVQADIEACPANYLWTHKRWK